MKNTETTKLSEEFQTIIDLIRNMKWDEVELQLRSSKVKSLNERELFLALYTTVLFACHEIPAQNPAISEHFLTLLDVFDKFNVNIDTISPQGTSIITVAAKAFQPELVKYFIDKKADVNISTCFGSPILELCGEAANIVRSDTFSTDEIELHRPLVIQTACILLENGADPNFEYSKGAKCIVTAIATGWIELIQLLLNYGADFTGGLQTERYSMEGAIKFATPEVLKLLLEYGLSPTVPLERKMSPLSFAKKYSKPDMVEILNQALSPGGIVRKCPTKSHKIIPQSEQIIFPLDNLLIGKYLIDIEATIKYHFETAKQLHGNKLPEGFVEEGQQLWNRNADGLKKIELYLDKHSLTLKNSEEEESFPLNTCPNNEGKTMIFVSGFCSNEIEIKKIKTDIYRFEAEDCQLSDAVWRKINSL